METLVNIYIKTYLCSTKSNRNGEEMKSGLTQQYAENLPNNVRPE